MIDPRVWEGRIYVGDCLEFLRSLPDGCVDLVLTDPPYQAHFERDSGGAFGSRGYFGSVNEGVGSSSTFEITPVLPEIWRVAGKPFCGYFWTSAKLLPDYLGFAADHTLHFDVLSWHKTNPLPTKNNKYLPDTEHCVFLRQAGAYFSNDEDYRCYRKWFLVPVNKSEYGHPTEKPACVIEPSIRISCPPGGIVLDPFLGSGTTAVVCERLGRRWIGCEINETYAAMAEKRIERERDRLQLPMGATP